MKTLKLKITLIALFAFIMSHAQNPATTNSENKVQQTTEFQNNNKSEKLKKKEARRQRALERKLLREKKHLRTETTPRKDKVKPSRELRRTERAAKKQVIY